MLNKLNTLRNNKEEGFTLIELIIVMAVIAILAGIASPLFLQAKIQEQTKEVKTDVAINVKTVATYLQDYPYALMDSTTHGCVGGAKSTPDLQPVVSNNAICISIIGNRENYVIRGSSVSVEGYYQYNSNTATYTKQGTQY